MQTNQTTHTANAKDIISELNMLLRGEMSAVETYEQAIDKLRSNSQRGIPLLQQLMSSHRTRADLLTTEVRRMGGEPSESSGPWGAFAKLFEGAAELFGEKSAIAALEEGEDHGLKQYRDVVAKVDGTTRKWLEERIYPEQKRSHDALSQFKHQLQAS